MRPLPFPKLHKSTGQAYVKYQKKMYYFGRHGTPGADQKYWEWRAGLEGITPKPDALHAPALPEVLKKYITDRAPASNKASQLRIILKHLTGSLGKLPVTKFGPLAFKQLRENIASTGTRCVPHVNALLRHLQLVFRWMVSEEIVPLSIWQELKTVDPLKEHPKCKPTVRRKPVPAAIVAAILPHLSEHCADMVRLIVATGARPGEILSLRAEEIVKNYQARPGWWFAEKAKHKTASRGKRRWVEFPPECHALLLRRWPGACGFFFPVLCPRKGMTLHYTVAALRQALGHACDRAKVERFSPYQLRHMTLTDIAGREGLARAAEVAGHDPRVTESHYLHEPPKRAG